MDPLLANLSNESLQSLVREQRPEWALGQERVGGFQSLNSPEVGARRFAAPSAGEARANVAKTFLEDAAPDWTAKIAQFLYRLGAGVTKDRVEGAADPLGPLNLIPGVAGVLGGAKAAANLGGKTQIKYILGREALEKGEAPQSVWRKYGVGKTPEGGYVFEFPLKEGETDAIHQFSQAYPDVTLKVLRGEGPREGYYWPPGKEIYAAGKGAGPITDFGSRRRVLEHELQHAADDAEGLSSGTQLADPNYRTTVGEVRARNAETRLDPAERQWEPSMTEDVDRLKQIIKNHPGAVSEAVKEKGGMWHPEAVERLAQPLKNSMSRGVIEEARMGHMTLESVREARQAHASYDWSDRAIRNYLNKYAGAKEDPLRDVNIETSIGPKRWEDITDDLFRGRTSEQYPDQKTWNLASGGGDTSSGRVAKDTVTSYLSHVGDYLRQNVAPEKLQQYDLVRAVKETAANDARVAREMEKSAAASMKDLPVYKDYSAQNPGSLQGMKWVELKKPEKLTAEQMKGIKKTSEIDEPTWNRDIRGRSSTPPDKFIPVGPDGKPITNSYTGELATGRTPEEAHLAGQLAQEGNQMGHCVGGYCEGVASGESRIFSLRDGKGKSHVTVEVSPPGKINTMREAPPDDFQGSIADWLKQSGKDIASDIVQIKGKQNRAPVAEYLPYVQDFVKSGKWGEVGDLGNAGLMATSSIHPDDFAQAYVMKSGSRIPPEQLRTAQGTFAQKLKEAEPYITKEEYSKIMRDTLTQYGWGQ